MSKIQNALGKIRTRQQNDLASSPKSLSGHKVEERPSIEDARLAKSALDDHTVCEVVAIDRQILREAGLFGPIDCERQIADQFRMIKRPLLNNMSGIGAHRSDDANLIMVMSALPGDGKTFNCINLALSMAKEKDTSVVLVDADVAKPHISQLFGLADSCGLIDLITDDKLDLSNVVRRTDVPGLMLLPAGTRDEHATEILASKRMAELVNNLSSSYPDRVFIFDSPPMLATSEAQVLAGLMGQIVLVVCAGSTPQNAVLKALEGIDKSKAINLVLNQATPDIGTGTYGTYGTSYGYGS